MGYQSRGVLSGCLLHVDLHSLHILLLGIHSVLEELFITAEILSQSIQKCGCCCRNPDLSVLHGVGVRLPGIGLLCDHLIVRVEFTDSISFQIYLERKSYLFRRGKERIIQSLLDNRE